MPFPIFDVLLDGELASKKNNKVIRRDRRTGRVLGLMENRKVRAVESRLVYQMQSALRNILDANASSLFPSQSLRLVVEINKDSDQTRIRVEPIEERPKGRTGRKRDIQNELGIVCDALEKSGVVANDNQFAEIRLTRIVNGKVC